MPVFYITLERISTGEKTPSMVFRGADEAAAREHAETALKAAGENDIRVYSITERE